MVLRAPMKMPPKEGLQRSPLDVTLTRKSEATAQFNATNSGMAVEASSRQPPAAVVQILNGPNAGKELELVKNLTTLGKQECRWRCWPAVRTGFSLPCGRRQLPYRERVVYR